MTDSTMVSLIKNLDVTELAGEKVMIDFATGKYFLLKGTANDIWELIQTPTTVGDIKSKLLDLYEVDVAMCNSAVTDFISQLLDYKFVKLD